MNELEQLEGDLFADNEDIESSPEHPYGTVRSTRPINITSLPDDYNYDYDIETNLNSFFWDELLPTLIVYSLTFILGLVGNVLIIFTTFRYRKMKSTTNVFLASLASADLLLIVFCIPVKEPQPYGSQARKKVYCSTSPLPKEIALDWLSYLFDELAPNEKGDAKITNGKTDLNFNKVSASNDNLEKLMLRLNHALKNFVEITKLQLAGEELKQQGPQLQMVTFPVSFKNNSTFFSRRETPENVGLGRKFFRKNFTFHESKTKSPNRRHSVEEKFEYPKPRKKLVPKPALPHFSASKISKENDSLEAPAKTVNYVQESSWNGPSLRLHSNPIDRKLSELDSHLKKLMKTAMYSASDQELIKYWAKRLKEMSNAILNRLKPILEKDRSEKNSKSISSTRGYQSEPESSFQVNHEQKPIILQTSGSEIQLNVGMEITMENCDPVTGEKLRPEVNRDFEQEGNIQCRLLKPGESPITFIDTDFRYNPQTGMLFENAQPSWNNSIKLRDSPVNQPKTYLVANPAVPLSPEYKLRGKSQRREQISYSEWKPTEFRDLGTSHEVDPFRLAILREEMKMNGLRFNDKSSKAFAMEDKIRSAKRHDRKKMSLLPTARFSPKLGDLSQVHSHENLKLLRKNNCSFYFGHATQGREVEKLSPGFPVIVMDQGIQVCLESKKKLETRCRKSVGLQVEEKSGKREVISRGASSLLLEQVLASSRGINVSQQTLALEQEKWRSKEKGTDFGSQTVMEADELQRCKKDLETQKKLAKLFSYTWTFGFFVCKLVYYMQSVSTICSVLTLTVMSVERYYAIVHPIKAQYICTISQAKRIITATWISSFFLAIPVLFTQIHMPVGVRVQGFWCVRDYDSPTVWRAHETYMLLLILVIPTVVMGVAYTTICVEIWEVMQRRQDLTGVKIRLKTRNNEPSPILSSFDGSGRKQNQKFHTECGEDEVHVKQVIKMLVAVVVIYVFCWAPLLIDNILQSYGILPFMKFGKQKYLATTFHLMAYFNSCINPIIYGFMSKNFRDSFYKTLCCGPRKSMSTRNASVFNDRSTSVRNAESRSVEVLSRFHGSDGEYSVV